MSKEAMKLALEALEKALRYHGVMLLSDPPQDAWKYHRVEQTAHEAITALREALAEQPAQQEPWVCECKANSRQTCKCAFKAQQKPVAFIDMSQWPPIRWRDGMIRSDVAAFDGQPLVICGHCPQAREPLTDEEIRDSLEAEFLHSDGKRNWHDDLRVARAIEAKLKELNT